MIGARLGSVRAGTASADVWAAWISAHAPEVDQLTAMLLSSPEQRRRARYRSAEAAARYVVTRALVRGVLGSALHVQPVAVAISHTDLGKPVVSGELHFNVSHSGDLVLLAVGRERAVGIDVERQRRVARAAELIARWLTERERRDVSALVAAGASDSDAFLRVWSLKEARLKALGVGIAGAATADVNSVAAVPLDGLLHALGARAGEGYVGAVAFA